MSDNRIITVLHIPLPDGELPSIHALESFGPWIKAPQNFVILNEDGTSITKFSDVDPKVVHAIPIHEISVHTLPIPYPPPESPQELEARSLQELVSLLELRQDKLMAVGCSTILIFTRVPPTSDSFKQDGKAGLATYAQIGLAGW